MTAPATNPLVDDRDVELILDEVLDVGRLLTLPHFAEHDRETCQMLIAAARDLARDVLFPAYRALDAEPPRLVDGRVLVHPRMRELYARMTDLGVVAAPRSHEVGGAQLPLAVLSLAAAYLMAANLSAYGYVGLTQGAAHLLEAFGNDELRASYMARMYRSELEEDAVIRDFRITAGDDKTYETKHYNLSAIIAVGGGAAKSTPRKDKKQ